MHNIQMENYFLKMTKQNNKVVRNDPLFGASGHSDPPLPSSEGPGLTTVESAGV